MGYIQVGKKFKEYAVAFLETSKYDLEQAENCLEDGAFANSVFFSQQCVEKAVKALLEMKGYFEREHDLSAPFLNMIIKKEKDEPKKKLLFEILNELDWFKGAWQKTRYPQQKDGKIVAPLLLYSREESQKAIKKAQFVFDEISKILNEKYKVRITKEMSKEK